MPEKLPHWPSSTPDPPRSRAHRYSGMRRKALLGKCPTERHARLRPADRARRARNPGRPAESGRTHTRAQRAPDPHRCPRTAAPLAARVCRCSTARLASHNARATLPGGGTRRAIAGSAGALDVERREPRPSCPAIAPGRCLPRSRRPRQLRRRGCLRDQSSPLMNSLSRRFAVPDSYRRSMSASAAWRLNSPSYEASPALCTISVHHVANDW
jgi:hypothetical protein